MAEIDKVLLKCGVCGREFHCQAPAAPGNYSVSCTNPDCKAKVAFIYPVKRNVSAPVVPDPPMGLLENGNYRFICDNCACRQMVLVPADAVKTGHNKALCPKCQTLHEFDIRPSEAEMLKCQDPDCGAALARPDHGPVFNTTCGQCGREYSIIVEAGEVVNVIMKTPVPVCIKPEAKMKLVHGYFLGKREYVLVKGSHYVGRADEAAGSDFQVKDKYASSRSLRIDVNESGGRLIYKLTVERAKNPVYHNNRELMVGDVVYITYGDTIKLGKTLIKVQKVSV